MAVIDSLVLKSAVKLEIFDVIHRHGRPISLPEIAAALPSSCFSQPTLRRFMRYLSHMRLVLDHDGDDERELSFTLSPAAAAYLVKGSKLSLTSFVQILLDENFLGALHALDLSVASGGDESAFELITGETVFSRAASDEVLSRMFNEGMAGSARITAQALVNGAAAAFDGVRTVVDVGGGMGTVAREIRRAFPWITCTVFDLPYVVKGCLETDGVNFLAGDMFAFVPRADAVLLMRILHDWGDEKALDVLRRCKEAIDQEKGKLIIVEIVVNEDELKDDEMHHARLASDILMMAYGGKERTEKEWRNLLLQAGFTRCNITRIMALQHVIEARP
ncbi:hypothetical protein HPP92_008689 [Vanilla planifolia]|uniref:Uncharacterized protein n=1 Tax=Vanilla planifolia TaxID=51239 RepID=A0A835V400_VANPL|nr:hypothetical protein HPP92_008689 [Vanilla planifolia]